ncbi:MAG: MBL fold metallo-hydrolase [Ruthenibacterium sp.]
MDPLQSVRSVHHGSVCLVHDDVTVYVDPYCVENEPHDADAILITHAHADHYSPADIAKVCKDDTCYVTTAELAEELAERFHVEDCYLIEVSCDTPSIYLECGVGITPVAAYNKNHPIERGFGAVVSLGGFCYYLSGDTDVLATDVHCDVLFVCCDGIYNMPHFETDIPKAILEMDALPGIVVPYHYGEPGMEQCGAKLCAALSAAHIPCREW